MTLFFTADTHFGHQNIITFSKRPYISTEEMDAALIANWNATVQEDDIVYHLGDFSFGRANRANEILPMLNGEKHLIKGNHDKGSILSNPDWASVRDYAELPAIEGFHPKLVLYHYPIQDWNNRFHGAMHLHGHVHGTLPLTTERMDMGVDVWGYKPVSIQEIMLIRSMLPAYYSGLTEVSRGPNKAPAAPIGSDEIL